MKTYIIAEIGSNHDGQYGIAETLIRSAKACGADAVKFQLFDADQLACRDLPQWEALRRTALPRAWWPDLNLVAHQAGIELSATPFDLPTVEIFQMSCVPWIKIASGDLTYHRLIRAAAATGLPLYISTGAASLSEVRAAYAAAHEGAEMAGLSAPEITFMHCTVAYPCRAEDVNLRAVWTLLNLYGRAGFSDHTLSVTLPAAAVAMGASVIEKHFTLNRDRRGPDHGHSLEPPEFAAMVAAVRETEAAMGSSLKRATRAEIPMRMLARRGLYLTRSLQQGEIIGADDIAALRPVPEASDAVAVEDQAAIVGSKARFGLTAGSCLTWDMIRG